MTVFITGLYFDAHALAFSIYNKQQHAIWQFTVHTTGQLTNTRRSDGTPELDGTLREVSRKKILHYHQLYINRPDPIGFLPDVVDTTGRLYDDFSRLLFLHAHRETSVLTSEIPEESDQFRFLRET
jgi:hypothetical protein